MSTNATLPTESVPATHSETAPESPGTTTSLPTSPDASTLAHPQKMPVGRPFLPGNRANPGGRPKKRPFTERIVALAEHRLDATAFGKKILKQFELPPDSTWGDAATMAGFLEAVRTKNGTLARKDLREAVEGKAPQRVEIVNPMDKRTELAVTFKRAATNNPRAIDQATAEAESVQVSVQETVTENATVASALSGADTPETSENG